MSKDANGTGPAEGRSIFRFKVGFRYGSRATRTIGMRGDQTLHDLHFAIQEAFEWDADHLYSFYMTGRARDEDSEFGPWNKVTNQYLEPWKDSKKKRLDDLDLTVGHRFLYLFDFGDMHKFNVDVEEIGELVPEDDDDPDAFPRVVASKGKAPEQYPDWE